MRTSRRHLGNSDGAASTSSWDQAAEWRPHLSVRAEAHSAELQLQARPSQQGIAVAALHSLSLFFFPRWFRQVKDRTGPLDSRLLADDFHSCLLAITEGNYDFLLTFHHPDVPILLDPELFPYVLVGHDSLVPVVSPGLADAARRGTASVLHYAPASFLGRITTLAQGGTGRGTPLTRTRTPWRKR